jgi:hypothetical protein
LASIAITFLSNAVGSCPAGTRHFLRLLNMLLEFWAAKVRRFWESMNLWFKYQVEKYWKRQIQVANLSFCGDFAGF